MGHLYEDDVADRWMGNFVQEQGGCVATILCRDVGGSYVDKEFV